MNKFVKISEKPTARVGLSDWYSKHQELQHTSDALRVRASDLRSSGRVTRFETTINTQWSTSMNDIKLAHRISEVSKWNTVFKTLLESVKSEIQFLTNEKVESEKLLEKISIPLQIVAQCISVRDCRRSTELTYDDTDTELKNELRLIEQVKLWLNERIEATWEKLNRLNRIKFKLEMDIQDKMDCIEVDNVNLNLNHNSSNISYKSNVLRIVNKTVSYETWKENCCQLKILTENELSDTYNFRESILFARERGLNDIKAQQDTTDFSLRKRIYQTQKARNELEWQRIKTEEEMEALKKELVKLEKDLSSKKNVVKCAETRLENRSYRPGFELCVDEVDEGLKEEILQLKSSKMELINKINSAKAMYNNLEDLLTRIKEKLDDKQHSLTTEIMCLNIRMPLKNNEHSSEDNKMDRNIDLMQMGTEIHS